MLSQRKCRSSVFCDSPHTNTEEEMEMITSFSALSISPPLFHSPPWMRHFRGSPRSTCVLCALLGGSLSTHRPEWQLHVRSASERPTSCSVVWGQNLPRCLSLSPPPQKHHSYSLLSLLQTKYEQLTLSYCVTLWFGLFMAQRPVLSKSSSLFTGLTLVACDPMMLM